MALQKKFSDPTGADATYWVIAHVNIDKLSESGGITLTGYQDRQTRLDDPAEGIVQRRQVSIPTEDFRVIYDNVVNGGADLYTELYDYVKNNVADGDGNLIFDDATDV